MKDDENSPPEEKKYILTGSRSVGGRVRIEGIVLRGEENVMPTVYAVLEESRKQTPHPKFRTIRIICDTVE